MKIEDQVCSLEYAKKLKELQVNQNSLWFWVNEAEGSDYYLCYEPSTFRTEPYCEFYSAFTVAELGEMLPWSFEIMKCEEYYSVWYKNIFRKISDNTPAFHRYKLADALSEMLIHLLKNKLIEL